jgi:hypothetical protein
VSDTLLPGQLASDRPYIVAQVFNLRFSTWLNDIMKHHIFEPVIRYVYTMEYQKWGLPHVHLIVFLHSNAWLSTPERVDEHISM